MSNKQIVTTVNENGQKLLEYSETPTGDGDLDLGPVVCAEDDTTDLVFAIDVSQVKSLVFKASGPCSIKTNSASEPDYTLDLADAPHAYLWTSGSPAALVLVDDVTSLHVVVPDGGGDVTLEVYGRYDATV